MCIWQVGEKFKPYNHSKKMFTRKAKSNRLIGDPDKQRPVKWRFTVLR